MTSIAGIIKSIDFCIFIIIVHDSILLLFSIRLLNKQIKADSLLS